MRGSLTTGSFFERSLDEQVVNGIGELIRKLEAEKKSFHAEE